VPPSIKSRSLHFAESPENRRFCSGRDDRLNFNQGFLGVEGFIQELRRCMAVFDLL